MKTNVISLAVAAGLLVSFAFQLQSDKKVVSDGSIGDVKYSVLPPKEFQSINGKNWRLLDGGSIEGTALSKLVAKLPDARGVFIRCLNADRNPAQDETRAVGDFQKDAVGPVDFSGYVYDNGGGTALRHANTGTSGAFNAPDEHLAPLAQNTSNTHELKVRGSSTTSANETRPKNISLYAYVKVN